MLLTLKTFACSYFYVYTNDVTVQECIWGLFLTYVLHPPHFKRTAHPANRRNVQIGTVRLHYSNSTSSCTATINNPTPTHFASSFNSLWKRSADIVPKGLFFQLTIDPNLLGCFQRRTCEPLFTTTIFSPDRTVHPSFPVLVTPFSVTISSASSIYAHLAQWAC